MCTAASVPCMAGPRVVAVTGGARGIGLATARALVADGARVAIGDLDSAAVGGAAAYPLDVTSPVSFAQFLTGVERDLGPLDALVNNAGVLAAGPVADQPDHVTRRIIEVNLLGVITGTRLALRAMLPRGPGTSSTSRRSPVRRTPAARPRTARASTASSDSPMRPGSSFPAAASSSPW